VDLDDIYVVSDRLETASATDVTQAEHELGCRFPTGYAEYVQRLGRGSLNDLVRVMLPGQIVAERGDWWARWTGWNEFWFWDDPESAVDQDHVLWAVPMADTENGDQLCFHPDDPDTVIVLPRDVDRSYAVGSGLAGAIDWVFSSGVLHPPGGPSAFHSHVGRKYVRHESQASADLASARDALLALGTHALVDQFHDDHCVVYFPSIKGRVVLMELDGGDVDALIVHDDGVALSSLTVIQTALERAGFPFSYSWG
jgi:SMI1 / KNR4 family (SUKH-1)